MTGVREELAAGIAGEATSILPSLNVKTARSCRGILPLTHLAREGRMTVTIGRRELLVALGGAAAWPLAARGQQPAMPVVGLLSPLSPGPAEHVLDAFRRGLAETGCVEGQNVAIEYRLTEGRFDRFPEQVADLVHRQVSVIASPGARWRRWRLKPQPRRSRSFLAWPKARPNPGSSPA